MKSLKTQELKKLIAAKLRDIKKKRNIVLKLTISILLAMLFITPLFEVFSGGYDGKNNEEWLNMYFYEDKILLILFSPFYILWVVFFMIRKNNIIGIVLLILSALIFIYGCLSLTSFSMDLALKPFFLIIFMFLPLLILLKILDEKEKSLNKINPNLEFPEILDSDLEKLKN